MRHRRRWRTRPPRRRRTRTARQARAREAEGERAGRRADPVRGAAGFPRRDRRPRRAAADPVDRRRSRRRRPRLLLGPAVRRSRGGTGRHAARGGPGLLDGVAARHHRRRGGPRAGHPGVGTGRRARPAPPSRRARRPVAFPYPAAGGAPASRRRDRRRLRRHHRRRPHPQRQAARTRSAAGAGRAGQVGARGGRHAAARDGPTGLHPTLGADRRRGDDRVRPRTGSLQPGLRRTVRDGRGAARTRLCLRVVRARLLVAAQAVHHRDTRTLPGARRGGGPVRTSPYSGGGDRRGTAADGIGDRTVAVAPAPAGPGPAGRGPAGQGVRR